MTSHAKTQPIDRAQAALYDQLYQIAKTALRREPPGHLLQATLLANDAYMKLLDQKNLSPNDASAKLAAGSIIIRRLLVDDARRRNCLKRGGPLTSQSQTTGVFVEQTRSLDLIELNDALELLQTRYPRAAQVVEFRFFAGLTYEEISEQLAISVRTVKSDWQFAKCWLYRELEKHT
ncbi:MAG: hypothetical protein CBB71_18005 [Rhodopirellula sp. TMED11]|nr:MAG: hypothetical protein CBB71_18005 [Rhodopirellula sp. TMED11]